jgi:DNA mismatch repair protein MSH5
MIDLNQVSLALRNSTARSLLILDEFGKGTKSSGSCNFTSSALSIYVSVECITSLWNDSPRFRSATAPTYAATDGAGLFCGVLKHILNRGPQCPKVLAATHFHNVFRPDLLDPASLPITFLHMDILFVTGGDESFGENSSITNMGSGEKITYLYR